MIKSFSPEDSYTIQEEFHATISYNSYLLRVCRAQSNMIQICSLSPQLASSCRILICKTETPFSAKVCLGASKGLLLPVPISALNLPPLSLHLGSGQTDHSQDYPSTHLWERQSANSNYEASQAPRLERLGGARMSSMAVTPYAAP